jgi:hypothetical protein
MTLTGPRRRIELLTQRLLTPGKIAIAYPSVAGRRIHWFQGVEVEHNLFIDEWSFSELRTLGYEVPVSYAVLKGIDLFARRGPAEFLSARGKLLYSENGRRITLSLSNYARRNYGFQITFGHAHENPR